MKVTIPEFPDWAFEIKRCGCFRFATVIAPNGYVAQIGLHEGNPNNVFFMLIEELLDKSSSSSSQSSA